MKSYEERAREILESRDRILKKRRLRRKKAVKCFAAAFCVFTVLLVSANFFKHPDLMNPFPDENIINPSAESTPDTSEDSSDFQMTVTSYNKTTAFSDNSTVIEETSIKNTVSAVKHTNKSTAVNSEAPTILKTVRPPPTVTASADTSYSVHTSVKPLSTKPVTPTDSRPAQTAVVTTASKPVQTEFSTTAPAVIEPLPDLPISTPAQEPGHQYSVSVRGLDELRTMREMCGQPDDKLNDYILSLEGDGIEGKKDLLSFISVLEKLPFLKLIDGEISWIKYICSISETTGVPFECAYITVSSGNEWLRLEYMMSVKNINDEIKRLGSDSDFNGIIYSAPIENNERNVSVLAESRKKHVSGSGDVINWYLDINGIYTRAVYSTENEQGVSTKEVFNKAFINKLF